MVKCPKCRRKIPDESIDPIGVLCPGCGSKIQLADVGGVANIGECKGCCALFPTSQLAPVPLGLRIVAFPLILLMLLHHPAHIRRHGHEIFDQYCPGCWKRQAFCYAGVGLWSLALAIGLIYKLVANAQ
jgi:hypothetical protein